MERVVNPESFEDTFQGMIEDVLKEGYTLYDSLRPHMRDVSDKRALQIFVVDDPTLNAVATSAAENDQIYLYRGAFEYIYGTMLALLCMPTFMPNVGDVEVEEAPPDFGGNSFPPMPFLLRNQQSSKPIAVCIPNDNARSQYGFLLAEVALSFLMAHEIGHIVGGHASLLQTITGDRFITEFHSAYPDSDYQQLRRVIECDADSFACHTSAFQYNNIKIAQSLYEITKPKHWEAKYFALVTYITAISVLFRLLYPTAQAHLPAPKSDYPHPAVRACTVCAWTLGRAMHNRYITEDIADHVIGDSARKVEEVWIDLRLPGQYLDPVDVWAREVGNSTIELVKEHAAGRTLLEKHARLPRRWDDWEWPNVEEPT